jgi:hypothetical protein
VTSLRISFPRAEVGEVGEVGPSVVDPTVSAVDSFEAPLLMLVFFFRVA